MALPKPLLYALPVLLFLGLAGAFYIGLGRDPSVVPSPLIDRPAPTFTLPPLLDDKGGLATQDLAGKVTLVNVFASWCAPCRAEHPVLMRLAKDGVELVGIDYKDDPAAARIWLSELGDPFRRIGADRAGSAAIDWGVYGVPESFVIDKNGVIRYKQVGPLSVAIVDGTILPLMRKLAQ